MGMNFGEIVKGARADALTQADAAMESLSTIASGLRMHETAARLTAARQALATDTFRLVVVGRFKAGKSTLLNALLGKLTHPVPGLPKGKGPLPVNSLPCTAALTIIHYAELTSVAMVRVDGKREPWSLARYLQEGRGRQTEAETEERFRDVQRFELGFPTELGQAGIMLVDSPGLDDVPQRTAITLQALEQCDAALVVYSSPALAGQGERQAANEVLASGTRVFTVINLWAPPADDELTEQEYEEQVRGFVWGR